MKRRRVLSLSCEVFLSLCGKTLVAKATGDEDEDDPDEWRGRESESSESRKTKQRERLKRTKALRKTDIQQNGE